MKVKAVEGIKVPYEHQPHQYIEQLAVEVDNTLYYQRRISDGDLMIVSESETKTDIAKKSTKE